MEKEQCNRETSVLALCYGVKQELQELGVIYASQKV